MTTPHGVHLVGSVPLSDEDEVFATVGGVEVYVGLVHFRDGVEGAQRRAAVAARHFERFGVATECGMGRRPEGRGGGGLAELERLLAIHREVATPVR